MTEEQLQILDDLAALLESGNLPCKFDYSVYGNGNGDTCGTVACAAGLLPYLRPDKFRWTVAGSAPIGIDERHYRSVLGLSYAEKSHLFNPGWQRPYRYGGAVLAEDATPEEVAANIREFVRLKKEGTI